MKLTLRYCAGCIYNGGGTCEVPPGRPRTMETVRLCHQAGWRVRQTKGARDRTKTPSTGEWATFLEGR